MKNSVFIACCKDGIPIAQRQAKALELRGVNSYIAADYAIETRKSLKALRGAAGVIFVLSPGFERTMPDVCFSLALFRYIDSGIMVAFDLHGVTVSQVEDMLVSADVINNLILMSENLKYLIAKPELLNKITDGIVARECAREMLNGGLRGEERKQIRFQGEYGDKALEDCLKLLEATRGSNMTRVFMLHSFDIQEHAREAIERAPYSDIPEMEDKYGCFNPCFYPGLEENSLQERKNYCRKNIARTEELREQAVAEGDFGCFEHICLNGMMAVSRDGVLKEAYRSMYAMKIPAGVKFVAGGLLYGSRHIRIIVIPSTVVNIGSKAFAECERLNLLVYCGSKAEWDEVDKAADWIQGSAPAYVRCTDGEFRVN